MKARGGTDNGSTLWEWTWGRITAPKGKELHLHCSVRVKLSEAGAAVAEQAGHALSVQEARVQSPRLERGIGSKHQYDKVIKIWQRRVVGAIVRCALVCPVIEMVYFFLK